MNHTLNFSFLSVLPVALAHSFSGSIAICCVLLVFVDAVMFTFNGLFGDVMLPQRPCCSVVHVLIFRQT